MIRGGPYSYFITLGLIFISGKIMCEIHILKTKFHVTCRICHTGVTLFIWRTTACLSRDILYIEMIGCTAEL